ncbi:MAG: CBS domain-containing protein [Anaerolineae bacterium]|jgi:CBS domain-containing protein/anti-sigma regulatory factor (Ser/Thr protein kinase)
MSDLASSKVSRVQELIYELRVQDVMQRDVISISPQTSMREFKELLRLKRISGTPVVQDGQLVGILSLEDLIKALEQGEMSVDAGCKMTQDLQTLYADQSVIHAVNCMARFGFGRLPVTDRSGKLVGILTRGDVIRGLLRRLEMDYHEEEIQRYRARHIFEDIASDRTSLMLRYSVAARDFSCGGAASSKIKRAIERLGGNPAIARRVGVAAYEAEMNLVIHSERGGEMVVEIQPDQVRIVVTDTGPGIEDIEQAMRPGYSTAPEWIREMGFGAGMGLLNIKQCADEMTLQSKPGIGTRLETWFRIPPPPAATGEQEDLL